MTFRGVYRDGIVILDDSTGLRNGTVVEVSRPAKKAATRVTKASRSKTPNRSKRQKAKPDSFLALAGIWKDRPEWKGKSTLEIHRELRAKSMGGRNRG